MDAALVDQLLVAGASLLLTLVATPVVRAVTVRLGIAVKVPGERHVHVRPTPELGGLAMLAGLIGGYAVARQLDTFEALFRTTSEPEAILLSALVITYVGVIDDTRSLSPGAKLAGQVLAAGTLVLFGVSLRFIYIPFAGGGTTVSLSPDAAALVTILAVVAMINAVNLVDGLDGLAAGIVAIAALALFAYAELTAADPLAAGLGISGAGMVLAAVIGTCLGFLVFNFHPASIFMGDTGAMLLGLLLAAAGVSVIGNTIQPSSSDFYAASVPALIPALVLAVPFIDTVLAILRRVGSGQPVASADKKHLHHRLLEMGHSQRRAVLLMYAMSALLAFGVVGPSLVEAWVVGLLGGGGALLLATALLVQARRTRREARAVDRATAPGGNVRRHPGHRQEP